MIKHFYSSPEVLKYLHEGPLGEYIDTFSQILKEKGYKKGPAKQKIRLIADFSHWLNRKKLEVGDLNEEKVEEFLLYRGQRGRIFPIEPPTLRDFLQHLRESYLIAVTISNRSVSDLDCTEHEFSRYLFQERGLKKATVDSYLRIIRKFLSERFGTRAVLPDKLIPQDIRRFIIRYAQTLSPKRAQLMVAGLRTFLRFLHQRGEITPVLIESVPTVANRRFSDLPKFLQPHEVEYLLDRCDRTHPTGQRDYAILLLLARLGLRAGEIVHMVLEDIDWENGEVFIRGKRDREDRLPLPYDVGKALATYLYHGRPRCSSRRIFIRIKAPHKGFASSVAICNIVERALVRANLHPPCKGAHLLRHSLATRMLRGGASLAEIGQILGHQKLETTQIYAKVDLESLRPLAQPWPGGES